VATPNEKIAKLQSDVVLLDERFETLLRDRDEMRIERKSAAAEIKELREMLAGL
jgi:outer membrane murein-binding lipoprotein Lpp